MTVSKQAKTAVGVCFKIMRHRKDRFEKITLTCFLMQSSRSEVNSLYCLLLIDTAIFKLTLSEILNSQSKNLVFWQSRKHKSSKFKILV
jgi:hypothetical protein